jgi:DNA repair protein RadC
MSGHSVEPARRSDPAGTEMASERSPSDFVRNISGPPRLIREASVAMAECPSCGVRMRIGAIGARWSAHTPRQVADHMILQLGSLEREELVVLLVNIKNDVVGEHIVYKGNISTAVVRTGELFTDAVRRCVPRVLLVHNHPSQDPTPSLEDMTLTAGAIGAGRLLDIEVLDHLIIGGSTFVSLRERGVAFESRDARIRPATQ